MDQIIQHSKPHIISHFEKVSHENLPESFKALLQTYPEVFTSEVLLPSLEINPPGNLDDSIVIHQKKPMGNKQYVSHNPQHTQNLPTGPVFPNRSQASDNYNSFNYKARSIIRAPFSSSGLSTDLGERVWFYIDEQNEIQGPFTTLEMDNWFEKGFLFDELKICHSGTNKFFPLFDLFVNERVKSSTNIEPEPLHSSEKTMKNPSLDVIFKEHFSNKNENKMFETLQNVVNQSPVQKGHTNEPIQSMERNIKQFNVIYPNISNSNTNLQAPSNVVVTPINPNFNPLLSQTNNPAASKPEQQKCKAPPNTQNNTSNQKIGSNLQKMHSDTKIDSKTEIIQQMNKDAIPFFMTSKKETEKRIEKEEIQKAFEEPKKKTPKTEYVRVYEPKKNVAQAEKESKQSKEVKPKEETKDQKDTSNPKELRPYKGNVDKEKYYIVYQPKQEFPENKTDRKLSGKDEEGKKEKKPKKEKRKHNSNSPTKEGRNDQNEEEKEETGGKFNAHFYPKESKGNNKAQRSQWVKEYVVKK